MTSGHNSKITLINTLVGKNLVGNLSETTTGTKTLIENISGIKTKPLDEIILENNIHKIALIKIDVDETQAFFVCVLVMLNTPSDPFPLVATGILEGTIKITSEGVNGFGYDPMFYPLGSNLSLAQIPNKEKAKLSHRGKAAETLRQKIKDFVSQ